ncbi:hypothetical protein AWN90_32205 [Nocardia terpenica]|uniref:Uncharacterized protein n=1 Tax=Nocardia terpenica TaxID=455432 RepID=A0A164MFZ6_9NOCA|nr:hypothetical protein AWN90_32205 [Nocardia terpenica]
MHQAVRQMVAECLWGSMPMMTVTGVLFVEPSRYRAGRHRYFEPGHVPFQPHPARHPVGCKPLENHTNDNGGQPPTERPTGHLDQIQAGNWPRRQC